MVDRQFAEPVLAQLYEVLHPWELRADFAFYVPLVMAAASVLDVGCGTGELLRRAREIGHRGRLCGLDPSDAMLDQARTRSDIEWILGDLAMGGWDREFDLVVMTGHAFQVLLDDDDIRTALAAIRAALADNGRFGFETRNPACAAWRSWTPDNAVEAVDSGGVVVRMAHEVQMPVLGDVVSFTTTFSSSRWPQAQVTRSTLRFVDAASLRCLLSDAGLAIEEQFGDWGREPLVDTSPEIITMARPA